ncbi:Ig-like domain repeat protein, partial [bacterium]|nr:Ig-like domain repeat protein [bacterium]
MTARRVAAARFWALAAAAFVLCVCFAAPARAAVSVAVTNNTVANQGTLPGEAFEAFTLNITNTETATVTVNSLVFTLANINGVGAGEIYYVSAVQNNSALAGDAERNGAGGVTVTLNANNTIGVGSTLTLNVWITTAGLADNEDAFTLNISNVNWTGPQGASNTNTNSTTNTVTVTYNVNDLTDGQVPDLVSQNHDGFPIFGISAAAANGEFTDIELLFESARGEFIPPNDFEAIYIYADADGDGKYTTADNRIKSITRTSSTSLYDYRNTSWNGTANAVPSTGAPGDTFHFLIGISSTTNLANDDLPVTRLGNPPSINNYWVVIRTGQGWAENFVGYGDEWSCTLAAIIFEVADTFGSPPSVDSVAIRPAADSVQMSLPIIESVYDAAYTSANQLNVFGERAIDVFKGSPVSQMQDQTALDFNPTIAAGLIAIGGPTDASHPASTLTGLTIEFPDSSPKFDPRIHLKPMTGDQFSGISIWQNSGGSGVLFSLGQDQLLPLSPSQTVWSPRGDSVTIYLQTGATLSATKEKDLYGSGFTGYDYWVNFLTSENINYEDTFRIRIPTGGIIFGHGRDVRPHTATTSLPWREQVLTFLNDLTSSGQEIAESSDPLAVVGLNLTDRRLSGDPSRQAFLNQLSFFLQRPSGSTAFTENDLNALSRNVGSGIAIYRDNDGHADNTNGVFDAGVDSLVLLNMDTSSIAAFGGTSDPYVVLNLVGANDTAIPSSDTGANLGDDFFLVVRTSNQADNQDKFQVVFGNAVVPGAGDPVPPNPPAILYTDTSNTQVSSVWATGTNSNAERFYTKEITVVSITAISLTDWTVPGQIVDALSDPINVIGMNVTDGAGGSQTLEQVNIEFVFGGVADSNVLADLTTTAASGVAIYKDGNSNGAFDDGTDPIISVVQPTWIGDTVRLILVTPEAIPDNDPNSLDDFFIVIRTGSGGNFGDSFQVRINGQGIIFRVGTSDSDLTLITNTLTLGIPIEFQDLTSSGQQIKDDNSPLPVIGIKVSDSDISREYLKEVHVKITDTGASNFNISDLADLTTDSRSGVSVWRDDGDGIFEQDEDTPLTAQTISYANNIAKLVFFGIRDTDLPNVKDDLNDFYVVLRPSSTINLGDDFQISIEKNGIVLSNGQNKTTVATKVIEGGDINTTGIQDLTTQSQRIDINSPDISVFGFNASDQNKGIQLNSVTVNVLNVNSVFSENWLASVTTGNGVALYRESNGNGVFDAGDVLISLSGTQSFSSVTGGKQIILTPSTPAEIPNDDVGTNNGNDFYVTFRTSEYADTGLRFNDEFQFQIPANGIQYSSNTAKQTALSNSLRARVPARITNVATDTTSIYLAALSETTAIIGVDALDKDSAALLASIAVTFVNINNFGLNDLLRSIGSGYMDTDGTSGVSLWADRGTPGVFDPADTVIFANISNPSGLKVKIAPASGFDTLVNASVPNATTGDSAGPDFFVVIRTASSATWVGNAVDRTSSVNDRFGFYVDTGDIIFTETKNNNANVSSQQSLAQKQPVIADTRKPKPTVQQANANFTPVSDTVYTSGEQVRMLITLDEPAVNVPVVEVNFYEFDPTPEAGFKSDSFQASNGGTIVITADSNGISYRLTYTPFSGNSGNTDAARVVLYLKDDVGNEHYETVPIELDTVRPSFRYIVSRDVDTIYRGGGAAGTAGEQISFEVYVNPRDADTNNITISPNFSVLDSKFTAGGATVTGPFEVDNVGCSFLVTYTINQSNTFDEYSNTIPITITDGANDTSNIGDTFTVVLDNIGPSLINVTFTSDTNFRDGVIVVMILSVTDVVGADTAVTSVTYSSLDSINTDTGTVSNVSTLTSIRVEHTIAATNAIQDNQNIKLPVTLRDKAGNVSTWPDSALVNLDNTTPSADITLPNSGSTFNSKPISVFGTSNDPDGNTFISGIQASNVSAVYIRVYIDTSGTGSSFNLTPLVTDSIVVNEADTSAGQLAYADWSFVLNPTALVNSAFSNSSDTGLYRILVRVVDRAGNNSGYGDTIQIRYDSGLADIQAPVVSNLSASPNPFSPNADGQNDITFISYSLSESIDSVALDIFSPAKNLVRTLTGDSQTAGANKISWDGKNTLGAVVAEGKYTIRLTAVDFTNNTTIETTTVVVDLTPGLVNITGLSPNPFSPNGDNLNDKTTVSLSISGLPASVFVGTVRIFSTDGGVTASLQVTSGFNTIPEPSSLVWIAKQASGTIIVNLSLQGTAANGTAQTGNSVTIPANTQPNDVFSIGGVWGSVTAVTGTFTAGQSFDFSFDLFTKVGEIAISVRNSSGANVGTLSTVPAFTGNGAYTADWAPSSAVDGDYTIVVQVVDDAGNLAQAQTTVTVQTTVLQMTGVTLTPANGRFSPNDDFVVDEVFVSLTTTKASQLSVKIFQSPADTVAVRTIVADTATRPAGSYSFTWDGKNDTGAVVISGDYVLRVTAYDPAENLTIAFDTTVTVDLIAPDAPRITVADKTQNILTADVSGIAEVGATVELYINGITTGLTTLATTPTGSFTFTAVALAQGYNNIHATAKDNVGNVSSPTGSRVTWSTSPTGIFTDTARLTPPRNSKVNIFIEKAPDTQTLLRVRGALATSIVEDTITIDTAAGIRSLWTGVAAQQFSRLDTVVLIRGDTTIQVTLRADEEFVQFNVDAAAPITTLTSIVEALSRQVSPFDGKSNSDPTEDVLVLGRSTPAGVAGGLLRVDVLVTAPNGTVTTVKTTDAGGETFANASGGAFDTWQVTIPNSVLIGGGEGIYNISATAVDNVGNVQATPTASSFIYDATPPAFALTGALEIEVDTGTTPLPTKILTSFDTTVRTGVGRVFVTLRDPVPSGLTAGAVSGLNINTTTGGVRMVDPTSASVGIIPGNNGVAQITMDLVFKITPDGKKDGVYGIYLTAVDIAGNTTVLSDSFAIDNVGPTAFGGDFFLNNGGIVGETIAEGEVFGRAGVDSIVSISVLLTDSSSQVSSDIGYRYSGGVNLTASSITVSDVITGQSLAGTVTRAGDSLLTITLSDSTPVSGRYRIVVTAFDQAGNQKTTTRNFTYDQTAPTFSVSPDTGSFVRALQFTVNVSDSGGAGVSGTTDSRPVMEIYYDEDGSETFTIPESLGTFNLNFDTVSQVTLTRATDGTQDGEYAVVVRVWDAAGNKYEDTRVILYDTVKPTVDSTFIRHGGLQNVDTFITGNAFNDSITLVGVDLRDTAASPNGRVSDVGFYNETTTVELINVKTVQKLGLFRSDEPTDTMARLLTGGSVIDGLTEVGAYQLHYTASDRAGNVLED